VPIVAERRKPRRRRSDGRAMETGGRSSAFVSSPHVRPAGKVIMARKPPLGP
jgi:hypothetical protein